MSWQVEALDIPKADTPRGGSNYSMLPGLLVDSSSEVRQKRRARTGDVAPVPAEEAVLSRIPGIGRPQANGSNGARTGR
jgi:hypothetical protein